MKGVELLLLSILFGANFALSEDFSFLNISFCGETAGCWFTPPNCEKTKSTTGNYIPCNEMVKWTSLEQDAVEIKLETTTNLLYRDLGYYIALAFSHDDKMGDDYVVECVSNPSGSVKAYVSFNDGTHNHRLHNASREQIIDQSGTVRDGRIMCNVVLKLTPSNQIIEKEAWQVFDLSKDEYILQFARGDAEPGDDSIHIHWLVDGDRFPWISKQKVSMGFGQKSTVTRISDAKHYDIPRSAQYRMTVAHGILMLFGWWVFGALGLLFGRYFKALWPNKTMLGVKVWYQMHRSLLVCSVVLQCVAFSLIFIQAMDFKFCTNLCDSEDYALYLHSVLGIACTAAALIQPFMAWFRPSKDDSKYKIFIWCHWTLGTTAWILATVVISLTPTLGKTGLRRNFGFTVDYLMAAFICSYVIAMLVLEALVQISEMPKRKLAGKSELPNQLIGPAKEIGRPRNQPITSQPKYGNYRLVVIFIFGLVAICICSVLSYQLTYNLKKKKIL